MTASQIIAAQLIDPFRIVLLVALVFTMVRTRHATGTWIPLLLGMIFVAIVAPATSSVTDEGASFLNQVLLGLASNAIVLGIILGGYEIFRSFRRR